MSLARDRCTLGLPSTSRGPECRIDGVVPYRTALVQMEERAAAIAQGTAPELLWLLEHEGVYTAGTSARPEHLIDARFPVHWVGRGGQFTYHGPGQRVGYVMLDLKQRAPDVRRFIASLEEWLIRTLATFGIAGERREDRIGIWVPRPQLGAGREDKIAAVGVHLKHWVSLHGIALNVDCDLSSYAGIVPCGIRETRYGVTSLAELGVTVPRAELDAVLIAEFAGLFGPVRPRAAAIG